MRPQTHPATPPTTSEAPESDAARVAAAVRALGPLDREALLRRVAGRSVPRIADETRTTQAMVRVRLRRAAAAVQRIAGPVPAGPVATPPPRPVDEVVTDAEVGITPVLHARLHAALLDARPAPPPRFRRLDELWQALLDHRHGFAAVGPVLGLLVVAVGALTTAA